jgi:hypothetical protein
VEGVAHGQVERDQAVVLEGGAGGFEGGFGGGAQGEDVVGLGEGGQAVV